jgi:dTDP-4-dehydrorhamnose reductase
MKTKKRALVIGGKGMLGSEMVALLTRIGWDVDARDLPELDITKIEGADSLGIRKDTGWVVNCAAYTAVDKAEDEPTKAFDVNAVGAGKVASICWQAGVRLLHVSTDYVFDGEKRSPYTETDHTNPLNTYGLSKRMGEVLVSKEMPDALIVRTQSLFGDGPNFVRSILRQVDEGKKELKVVDDQMTCPTYVGHLSTAMTMVMDREMTGILHLSAVGECSWFDFASVILAEKKIHDVRLKAVKTWEFPAKAQRPAYGVLSKHRFKVATGLTLPSWRAGLAEYLGKGMP